MMSETLTNLTIATILFVGSHFLLSWSAVREALVRRLGENPFRGIYSVLAIVVFVWMCRAYVRAPVIDLWPQGAWSWILALVVMPFASIFLVCGFSDNPTLVGGEGVMARDDPAPGILRVTRHPMLWAIALWALVHLAATGDAASLIFFGGLALLCFGGMAHIDARKHAQNPEQWQRITAVTSVIPFAAALAGRTSISLKAIGPMRIVIGLVLYALLLFGHEWAIGIVVAPI